MQNQIPLLNPAQTFQLSGLLETVKELTADSISTWHHSLGSEIQDAAQQIESITVGVSQSQLISELVQTFAQKQQVIINTLDPPLRAIQKLVESGHLSNVQKAKLLIQLGNMYGVLIQWNIALDQFNRALDYCQTDLLQKAKVCHGIARIKFKQGDFVEANKHYHASLAIYRELDDPYQMAQTYLNVGFNQFQAENYPEALENYQQALEIAQSTAGCERLVADAYMNQAILKTVQGDFQPALADYKSSIAAYTEISDARGLSQAYYNMGMVCVDLKDWQQAGACYQSSLEYAQKQTDLHLIGYVYLSYTDLALKLSDLELAQACCMHAIKTFGQIGGQPQLADAYKFGAIIQQRKANFNKSDLFFRRSIETSRNCGSRLNEAEGRYEYAQMLLGQPQPDTQSAKAQLTEALALFEALDAKADIQNTRAILDRIAEGGEGKRPRFRKINR